MITVALSLRVLVACGLVGSAACGLRDGNRSEAERAAPGWVVSAEVGSGERQPGAVESLGTVGPAARSRCEDLIIAAETEPGLPGAPNLDARRVDIFLAVKGEPTLFIREPEPAFSAAPLVVDFRAALARGEAPASVIARLVRSQRTRPEVLRAALLREGYLYADDASLAEALVSSLRADLLFRANEVRVDRGDQTFLARHDSIQSRYVYVDGPHAGRPVQLLLFDRVSEDIAAALPLLHRDVRSLRYRLGFHRFKPRHLAAGWIVAELEYGDVWVPTLLEADGARLELACEAVPAGREAQVAESKQLELARIRAFEPLQRVILEEIDEALPFDEPEHEIGQEDGKLRRLWLAAYLEGAPDYAHRGDRYRVFDSRGRPLVPQVCTDFILDTIERAAGTWWQSKGKTPERLLGRFDFAGPERGALRRATEFARYAEGHPAWFEVTELDGCERISLGQQRELGEWLSRRRMAFVPGDIVSIAGCVPWDRTGAIHYHTFFVFESDPLTGMPLLIAGNAGRPRIGTWKFEMQRTPERRLRHRIRPSPAWLASIALPRSSTEPGPPPLSAPH